MTEQTVYKVRNAEGLWSRGGVDPDFGPVGKTWSDRGAMLRHVVQVAQVLASRDRHRKVANRRDTDQIVQQYWPADWEIIPFVLVEQPGLTGASVRKGQTS
jgi:hypothetical protein